MTKTRTRTTTGMLIGALLALVGALTASPALGAKGDLSYVGSAPEFSIGTLFEFSPDGEFMYGLSSESDVLTLDRDPSTGALDLIRSVPEGVDVGAPGGVTDFVTVVDMAIAPDGETVYVTDSFRNSISVFDVLGDGTLSLIQVLDDDTGGLAGMSDPNTIIASPADFVLVADEDNDTIFTFDRAGDGTLSLADQFTNAAMLDPTGMAITSDGKAVYVAANDSDALVALTMDTGDGSLTFVESEIDGIDDGAGPVDGLNNVLAVGISANDAYVYTGGSEALAAFERSAGTSELNFLERETTSGNVQGLALSDGPELVTGGFSEETVYSYEIESDGMLTLADTETSGVDDPSDAAGVVGQLGFLREFQFSPDGAFLYANSPTGAPSQFGADGAELSYDPIAPETAIDEPESVAISPDGMHAFAASKNSDSLYSFARDPQSGLLSLVDTETAGVDDPSDSGPEVTDVEEPEGVTVSPDGNYVYMSDTSTYAVHLFEFDSATGELSFVESKLNEVTYPGDPGGEVFGLYEPYTMLITPDGKYMYVTGDSDDAIAAFAIDPADGTLSFLEAEVEGVNGVSGLGSVARAALSPDGDFLYVPSGDSDSVAIFSTNGDGTLDFVDLFEDGDQGVDLNGPEDIAVSPDGKWLFVVLGSEVLAFSRDAGTGLLTFVEEESDGVDDPDDAGGEVPAVPGFLSTKVSLDGAVLYVGTPAGNGSGILTFAIGSGTEPLIYQSQILGDDGLSPGLSFVDIIALSPDERHLYTADPDGSDTIGILSREDDFDAPDTTLAGGPGEGGLTKDTSQSFTLGSTEADSSYSCELNGDPLDECDGLTGSPSLDLDFTPDGLYTLSVAATDAEGNTDATPATQTFTIDTEITGGKVKAKKKQKPKLQKNGKKIKVEIKLKAREEAEGTGKGKIKVGKKSYKLKKTTKTLKSGKTKKIKLKLKKTKDAKKVSKAIKKGDKVTAKLTGKITDEAGNKLSEKKTSKLKK